MRTSIVDHPIRTQNRAIGSLEQGIEFGNMRVVGFDLLLAIHLIRLGVVVPQVPHDGSQVGRAFERHHLLADIAHHFIHFNRLEELERWVPPIHS